MENFKIVEDIRRFLDYNPETGEIIWKVSVANNRIKAGNPAGTESKDGKIRIQLKGKMHLAHRIAWLLTYGKWPDQVIDHIDGNPSNNCISNLRDVCRKINTQNQRKSHSDNKTKILGVSLYGQSGKFRATITIDGKIKHLGCFLTEEEARDAYLAAKRRLHKGCTI